MQVASHRDVEIVAGGAHWLPAQEHAGENIGDTATRTIFVELKEQSSGRRNGAPPLDPAPPVHRHGE